MESYLEKLIQLYNMFSVDPEIKAEIDQNNCTLVLRVYNNPRKTEAIEKLVDTPIWANEGTPRVVVIDDEKPFFNDETELVYNAFVGNPNFVSVSDMANVAVFKNLPTNINNYLATPISFVKAL